MFRIINSTFSFEILFQQVCWNSSFSVILQNGLSLFCFWMFIFSVFRHIGCNTTLAGTWKFDRTEVSLNSQSLVGSSHSLCVGVLYHASCLAPTCLAHQAPACLGIRMHMPRHTFVYASACKLVCLGIHGRMPRHTKWDLSKPFRNLNGKTKLEFSRATQRVFNSKSKRCHKYSKTMVHKGDLNSGIPKSGTLSCP